MSGSTPAPYSPAIRAGDFVYTAGHGGSRDPVTGAVIEGIEAQTRHCLERLGAVLRGMGSSLDDVVKVTVFLKDRNHFQRMNETYVQFFSNRRPTRSTIVTDLVGPDMLIEIECVAFSPMQSS